MNQLLKKGFLITIILLGFILLANPFFDDLENNSFKNTIRELKKSKTDSIDVLFFGSSHAMNSYNPEIIDKTLNTYSFNLGSAAQKLSTTKFLIKDVIEIASPKVVVLDIFEFTASRPKTDKEKGYQFLVYNSLKNSFNKFKEIYNDYSLEEAIYSNMPMLREHSKWNELLEGRDSFKGYKTLRGFVSLSGDIKEDEKKKYKDFYGKKNNIQVKTSLGSLKKEQRAHLIEINNILKERNIEFIIVSAPFLSFFYSDSSMEFNSNVKFLADSLNINFVDYNEKFDSLDLDFTDFKEYSHLNNRGANKLSAHFSKYLSNNTQLEITNEKYLEEYVNNVVYRNEEENKNRLKESNEKAEQKVFNEGVYLQKRHKFIDKIEIIETIFYSNDFERYIFLKALKSSSFDINSIEEKAIAIQAEAYEQDTGKLPDWVVSKKGSKTTWKAIPEILQKEGELYIKLSFKKNCDLENFKQIRLFLIDKEEYQGAIGDVFEINDITFVLGDGLDLDAHRMMIKGRESKLPNVIGEGIEYPIKHSFLDNLTMVSSKLYSTNNERYIALELNDSINENTISKYSFGIHGIAYEKDLKSLPDWVIEKGGNKTTWNSIPEKVTYEGENYLLLKFPKNCKIETWKKIRLFLYNRESYKGVVGKALEVENVKFDSK